MSVPALARSLQLKDPSVVAGWFDEPRIRFASAYEHEDPKVGIAMAGPRSLDLYHPGEVHVRFVGTAEAIDDTIRWLSVCGEGVEGDERHAPFPGSDSDTGFRFRLYADPDDVGKITNADLREVENGKHARDRFDAFLNLLDLKVKLLTNRDAPLDCVIIVLPDDLYRRFRSVQYREGGQQFHRDLRRAFKARVMEHKVPTQILRHATVTRRDEGRGLDHPATVAWNLFTGLYFKAGGAPWTPVGMKQGSCVMGISFYRPLGDERSLCTSVVQAFDEQGDVFVLRGHAFPWDPSHRGMQPHLTKEHAAELVSMVLERYQQERGQPPRRIVVHKRSRFEPDEREGFIGAMGKTQTDLVALRRADDFRLAREGQYPPLRGTWYTIGDHSYVYTTGYLHRLQGYPHGHVPAPLEVADHVSGDTPRRELLQELLTLTKMNWNSAGYAESLPITLRFAGLVGDIMKEIPADRTPEPRYAFYM